MDKLSEGEKEDIWYFWHEKGDLTRWSGWKETEPRLRALYPDLFIALTLARSAESHLDQTIRSICGRE